MSTPNKNGKNTTNGKANIPAIPPAPTAEELKAQALKEQQAYFYGLARLVFP